MKKIYVCAASKKQVNDELARGVDVFGYNHSMFGGGGWYGVSDLDDGDVVAVYSKEDSHGNPIAKSWGTYVKSKNKLK